MKKLSDNWMSLLTGIELYKTGKEFLSKFNSDLQLDFERITGMPFNGKEYFLVILGYGEIEYFDTLEIPIARLNARLLFYNDDGMPVSIIWFDRESKKIYKPGDDIAGSNLEFHWENFDVHHPALKELKLKRLDIRAKYGLYIKFPVISRSLSFGNDVEMRIKLKHLSELERIQVIFSEFQKNWNEGAAIKNQLGKREKLHSWSFEGTEDGKLVFFLDIGLSEFDLIFTLLKVIDNSGIDIEFIEMTN